MTKKSNNERIPGSTETPIVSVICRTMHRPLLSEALRSVAEQTHSRIELVVVDAAGQGPIEVPAELVSERLAQVSTGEKMSRPVAANAGLDAASGDYLLFLDEDDWIAPSHIEGLLAVLQGADELAAYSNTQKAAINGELLSEVFNRDFSLPLLMRDNFIPIHAVLFASVLREHGCRFDATLDIYEDWDFWLQVSQITKFVHVDKVTAFYRQGGESETALSDPMLRYAPGNANSKARELVLGKWISQWNGADVNRMLGSLDQTGEIRELLLNINALHSDKKIQRAEIEELQSQLREREKRLVLTTNALEKYKIDLVGVRSSLSNLQLQHNLLLESHTKLSKLKAYQEQQYKILIQRHDLLQQQHEELNRGVQEILQSFSWRITRPYRYLSHRVKHFIIAPVKRALLPRVMQSPTLHNKLVEQRSKSKKVKADDASIADRTEAVQIHVDSPSPSNALFSEVLVLQGWALAPSGVVEITVSIDGLEYFHFSPSVSRPDVQRLYPEVAHAATCGFFERLSLRYLASGEHQLRLLTKSKKGITQRAECRFFLYRKEELYNAWLAVQEQCYAYAFTSKSPVTDDRELQVIYLSRGDESDDLAALASLLAQQGVAFNLHYIGSSHAVQSRFEDELQANEVRHTFMQHKGISGALETVTARDEWVALLGSGCVLAPYALQRMLIAAEENGAELIYTDHDVIQDSGIRTDPVFTFSWSPEHLVAANYIGDVVLSSAELLLGNTPGTGLESYRENCWIYRFLLQASLQTAVVHRLPEVLWSSRRGSAETASINALELEAIEEWLRSNNMPATLHSDGLVRNLIWQLPAAADSAKVSIIIPTMGKLELVRPCIESLLQITDYPDYEVIILDNSRGKNPEGIQWLTDQGLKVLECNEAFNWARLNNRGAEIASGELLLFLNDDIEIRQADWLSELARQAQRSEVGAVGCKLLYPNGALQHAGVFLVNYGGGGLHLFHKMPGDRHIYQRLDLRVRETSAVTGACLMVHRSKFDAINGFDEELAVVGNDVDFCLRLLKNGYRNLWTSRCTLIHHESISREATVPPEDEKAMWRRWGQLFEAGDRYYNPNLSLTKWDCSQEFNVAPGELLDRLPKTVVDEQRDLVSRLQPGVNLIGYIRADMGLGEGARSDARALAAASLDFGIINFETGNPASMTNDLWRHKEILNAPYDINLIHINGDFLPTVVSELPTHFLAGRYNIAYWAWELEDLPEQWIPSLQFVDEIWVPSEFVKQAVEKVSNCPVITIPHNVDLLPNSTYGRSHFGIPEDTFAFLAMYDTRSIAERKNPRAALEAFKQAFAGSDDSVCLVLKLNNATDESVADLRKLIGDQDNVLILDKRHSRQEVDALLTQIDCFVSLHRSEGFGLGPTEAMSLGKPCILTNWSGNTDYMTPENCLAVDYELITIEQDFGPYNAGQRWADADVAQAAQFMSQLAGDRKLAAQIGRKAKESIKANFSPEAVGKTIVARLSEIRKSLHS